jgi:hypothetical protein
MIRIFDPKIAIANITWKQKTSLAQGITQIY